MSEEYGSFLDGYVELCRETEAPPIFGLWCGISAVSAALGRNSFLQFGQFPIYPNFFIIVVGSSGHYRKSTSIEMASVLVKSLQPTPRLISQKVTPEALIQAIRQVETNDLSVFLKESGSGYVIADEFNTFLNKKTYDAGLAALLIQMFDCKDEISYHTVGRGVESVRASCLGILGGTTVDWLRSGIPEEAIGGGLTSRMIFVFYNGPVKDISWPSFTKEQQILREKLSAHLQRIASIKGEFKIEKEAFDLYDKEYVHFRHEGGKHFFFDMNLRGYASRRHIHMLKLSMIFSAAERYDRVITEHHMKAAIESLKACEENLPTIIAQITTTNAGGAIDLVLGLIKRDRRISRSALLRAVSNRMNKRELDEILDTLMVANLIQLVTDGAATFYQIVEKDKWGT